MAFSVSSTTSDPSSFSRMMRVPPQNKTSTSGFVLSEKNLYSRSVRFNALTLTLPSRLADAILTKDGVLLMRPGSVGNGILLLV